jgi:hypothetical protein
LLHPIALAHHYPHFSCYRKKQYIPYDVWLRIIFIPPPMVYLFFFEIYLKRKKSDAIIEKKEKYFRALVENNQE